MASQFSIKIKGFLESSFLDWPGQVSSVIFLAGCNFRCPFCHNYGLVLNPDEYPTLDWDVIKARLKVFHNWIDGVVISGGEPTISPGLP
ncbi:MAG: radical SAM protein, partial [Deltaproteobacteria bacterium]|nr:radical SAM protein [Deltaproteobacteria bacterium]